MRIVFNCEQLMQRGISGCRQSGADAIIVSGERRGNDTFHTLKYVAEWRIGANALFKSYVKQSTIRVFRSLRYLKKNSMVKNTGFKESQYGTSRLYRYDGLYSIVQVQPPVGKNCHLYEFD